MSIPTICGKAIDVSYSRHLALPVFWMMNVSESRRPNEFEENEALRQKKLIVSHALEKRALQDVLIRKRS
jgi:hypothetical protein